MDGGCLYAFICFVLTSNVHDACVCASARARARARVCVCVCVCLCVCFICIIQRNWTCLTWKSAIEIKSLSSLLKQYINLKIGDSLAAVKNVDSWPFLYVQWPPHWLSRSTCASTAGFVGRLIACLLNVSVASQCISGMDLLTQLHVLPHWDISYRSNSSSHPVTVYWHRANQSPCWPYNAKRLAG